MELFNTGTVFMYSHLKELFQYVPASTADCIQILSVLLSATRAGIGYYSHYLEQYQLARPRAARGRGGEGRKGKGIRIFAATNTYITAARHLAQRSRGESKLQGCKFAMDKISCQQANYTSITTLTSALTSLSTMF